MLLMMPRVNGTSALAGKPLLRNTSVALAGFTVQPDGAVAVESPLVGPEGNREFLVGFRRGSG